MKIFLLLFILSCIHSQLVAQHFDKIVGVRMGTSPEFFYEKENSEEMSSLRIMGGFRQGGRQLTVMKIIRNYSFEEFPANVSFYYGYGIHTGTIRWNEKTIDSHGYYWKNKHAPVIGLTALVGLQYHLTGYPISITCDAKPLFDFWGSSIFKSHPLNIAFGAIYHF